MPVHGRFPNYHDAGAHVTSFSAWFHCCVLHNGILAVVTMCSTLSSTSKLLFSRVPDTRVGIDAVGPCLRCTCRLGNSTAYDIFP